MEAFREPVVAMSTNSASTVHTFSINRGGQYLRTRIPTISMIIMSTRTYTLYSASTYRINEGNEYLLYCTLYSV